MNGVALLTTLALIVLALVISSLHLALVHLARGALEDLAEESRSKRQLARVSRILDDVHGHARSAALVRILTNLGVAISMIWLASSIVAEGALTWPAVLLGGGVAAGALWVFGVVIPQSVAEHAGERFVLVFSLLVRVVHVVQAPIGPLARFLDEVVRRLSGRTNIQPEEQRETDLKYVIEDSEREGQIDTTERDMIEAVVQMRSRTVDQIMTPRTEIVALSLTDDLDEVISFVRQAGHSRIPVYRDSLDDVVGIFYVKDLLHWIADHGQNGSGDGEPFKLERLVRDAVFVPETKNVRELSQQIVREKVHIAMVADEYGGTSGLVTLEDIIEEVFGDIQDEYELPEDEVPVVSIDHESRSGLVDARSYIDDVNDALEPFHVAIPQSDDYDTLAGFVTSKLGRIPAPGEQFENGVMRFRIENADQRRVLAVRVEVFEEEDQRETGRRETDQHADDRNGSDEQTPPGAG